MIAAGASGRFASTGGAADGRAVAYLGGIASCAVCAAVGVVVGFASVVVNVITVVAAGERAGTVGALGRAVGIAASCAVRAAVGDGVGFTGIVVQVITAVARGGLASCVLADCRTVGDGACIAV